MEPLDDPFRAVDAEIAKYALGRSAHCILVDVHGEATSEKQSMGHHCDGRVTAVLGTHSHIPTADCWVLPGGTAYQTDVGMCGDYDSVIGMKKEAAVLRFIRKMPGDRLTPAEGEGTLCAALFETDDKTGLAKSVRPIRVGGRLPPAS
jgi:calcineurin-like phosphoesterase